MAAVLYPVGKMVNVASGISIEASVLIIGGIIILYTAAGGLWAVCRMFIRSMKGRFDEGMEFGSDGELAIELPESGRFQIDGDPVRAKSALISGSSILPFLVYRCASSATNGFVLSTSLTSLVVIVSPDPVKSYQGDRETAAGSET